MKLAIFDDYRVGVVLAGQPKTLADITELVPSIFEEFAEQRLNWIIRNWVMVRKKSEDLSAFPTVPLQSAKLRAVNPAPPQLFAIPANFYDHIGELGDRSVTSRGTSRGDAGFFLKAAGSVSGANDPITLPAGSRRRFDHECELGVIIGVGGANIPQDSASSHVFGYTCLIDMSMRIEKGSYEEDRSLRKSFATFTPTGPFLVTADEVPDLSELESRLSVNGEQRQLASFRNMIVSIEEAIELISSVVPLQAGDIIASGTPKGVGPVKPGDEVTIEIDSIGSMTLDVREGDPSPRPF